MKRKAITWLGWATTMAMVVAGVLLGAANSGGDQGILEGLFIPGQSVSFASVGLLLSLRRPGNSVGILFLVVGFFAALYSFSFQYQTFALVTRPGSLPVGEAMAWLQAWIYVPALATVFTFVPLVFPTGRLPSDRWRAVLVLDACALAGVALADALAPGRILQTPIQNPVGLEGPLYSAIELSVPVLLFPATILSVGALIMRWRRARGDERQQLKVFAFAASALPLAVLSWAVTELFALSGPFYSALESSLSAAAFLGLPVAAGVAILRYRLYDIDVVINRTLVYGALTLSLAAVYFAGVVGLGGIVRGLTGQENNSVVVAASTLAVAGMFRPARARIQRFIDRRFYRAKYDATQTLDGFTAKLRGEINIDEISTELLTAVEHALRPAHASLWLLGSESQEAR